MIPFQLDSIEELVDGRIFVRWTTIADDGLRLEEGDYFTPEPGESIELCLERCLDKVRSNRERINATPKVRPARTRPSQPARKRSTRVLSDERVLEIIEANRHQDGEIPGAGHGLVS